MFVITRLFGVLRSPVSACSSFVISLSLRSAFKINLYIACRNVHLFIDSCWWSDEGFRFQSVFGGYFRWRRQEILQVVKTAGIDWTNLSVISITLWLSPEKLIELVSIPGYCRHWYSTNKNNCILKLAWIWI